MKPLDSILGLAWDLKTCDNICKRKLSVLITFLNKQCGHEEVKYRLYLQKCNPIYFWNDTKIARNYFKHNLEILVTGSLAKIANFLVTAINLIEW